MPGSDRPSPDGALGREVERTARRIGALEVLVRQLADQVTELAEAVAGQDPAESRAWLLCEDPERAVDELRDLVEWVGAVYLRYPDAALHPCWLWHPAVLEELHWLRQAHHEAYDARNGSCTKAGDWHDRQRPGVTARVSRWLAECDLSLHPTPDREAALTGSADRIAHTWATEHATPQPTTDELDTAQQHDRTSARNNHR